MIIHEIITSAVIIDQVQQSDLFLARGFIAEYWTDQFPDMN